MGTFIGTIFYRRNYWCTCTLLYARPPEHFDSWTIICGAVGAAIGTWAATQLGVADTSGIDWIRWIISIIAAMLTISLYMGLTGKSKEIFFQFLLKPKQFL